MQGTRQRVLELVVQRREARVEELAADLGITTAAVRRHLDNLRADGLVEVRAVKQPTGRPYHAYQATESATAAVPAAYADLLERMLRGLGEQETVISTVMTSVAESLASRHRWEVTSVATANPEERVGQVTRSLRQEGILETWRADDDGFHLVNSACPYRKAAEISALPCESDRKAIELLLGLDVEQLDTIVKGSPVCEYLVRAVRGPQLLIEVS
ncbi:MAG: ArsR family transcriptional regulator [Chloroflexi bacterium]|nr:ArsR family transcriptional regulator [Chloroflexota bacterium]